nr:truncated envelope glycoprotein [Human immunodeficiency virus 1]
MRVKGIQRNWPQ